MTNHSTSYVHLVCPAFALSLMLPLALGCSPSSATSSPPPLSLPDTIDADGQTWRRMSATEADDALLTHYFAAHRGMVDNPLLEGSRALYVDARGHRRFYWVYPVQPEPQWMYLEFDKRGRYRNQLEGSGTPF
ncbi:MAG: hypothetical protein KatS3mg111_1874 [Pirellulaceae bacterium]|nr:MAG: hypothetical protein KatS3mg111_1874 [Pirellulaceae bacterium]